MTYTVITIVSAMIGMFAGAVGLSYLWFRKMRDPEALTAALHAFYEKTHRHWLQVSKEDDTPSCPCCGWVPNWRHRKLAKEPIPEGMEHPIARPKKPLSIEWTSEDRLRAVSALLNDLGKDIWQGRYSAEGRPNVTSLQLLLGVPAAELEEWRVKLESAVAAQEDGDCRQAMETQEETL